MNETPKYSELNPLFRTEETKHTLVIANKILK
jgi:hypothetical protein